MFLTENINLINFISDFY